MLLRMIYSSVGPGMLAHFIPVLIFFNSNPAQNIYLHQYCKLVAGNDFVCELSF